MPNSNDRKSLRDQDSNTGTRKPLAVGGSRRAAHARRSSAPSAGIILIVLCLIVGVVFAVALMNRTPVGQDVNQNQAGTTQELTNKTTGSVDAKDESKDESKDSSTDAAKDESKDSSNDSSKDEANKTTTTPVDGDKNTTNDKKDGNKDDSQAETAKISNEYKEGNSEDSQGDNESEDGSESESDSSSDKSENGNSDSAKSSSSKATGEWIDAEACASSAAETGSVTASGIEFDDSTPQVALDRKDGASEHFGDYVEIRYGDVTVTAQVVDQGALHSGTNGILLNPGVFEALGATSSDDWGRRSISYRFV